MNPEQREQVRSNAKYLRQVRPIDPNEICSYVEGEPHPAAIRQVLRESAPALGLLERADGTFVPVADEPIDQAAIEFSGVTELPERHVRTVEELLVERYGPDWPSGESGDYLRERIRAIKEDYLHQRDVEYDDDTALAYAIYHLPDYYAAVQYVLADLIADKLLPRHLRVLDVGAGVGGPALGLLHLVPEGTLVDYHAVEPSEAADVLESTLADTGRNVHVDIHRTTAEACDPTAVGDGSDGDVDDRDDDDGATFDLVLFANVLSELDDPGSVVRRYAGALADDGTLLALAPADRNTATNLRTVERAVTDDGPLTVYEPTIRLWPDGRPTDDMWSFDVQPNLTVPPFQRRLDGASSDSDREFINTDVQYAYSVVRPDGRTPIDYRPDPDRRARLAESDTHVTNRIDCVAIKLSHDLGDGDNALYRIGDGSQSDEHFLVLTEQSVLNEGLPRADYGDLLLVENVLVLYNDDEDAYNLVVDGETVVDAVPV